ncbi:hypothetical protein B0H13DRAFT_2023602 [Mycena leptocephala]|nr:hypothetical protein B0H13DRAFT_2023602 [Mycena leptocephala]
MSTITQILFNSPALLKRDQLVKLCELHSIEANGKNVELVERLKTHAKDVVFRSEQEGTSVAQDDAEAEAPQEDSSSPATSSQGILPSLKSSATLPKEFGTGSSSSASHRPNPCTNPARIPLTRPYDSRRRSYRELLRRHDVTMCLASIQLEVIAPRWQKYSNSFLKIIFDPRYIHDVSAAENGEENSLLCFITFNDDAKSLAALAGPDGEAFVKAAKEVMKISPEEEASFMWYRCSAER